MTTQTSTSTFSKDKIRTLRLVHMTHHEARDVLYQIFQWGTQDKDPNMPLEEYINKTVGYSNTKIRNSFNVDQRELMKTDPSGSTFDITILIVAISMACKGLRRPYPCVPNKIEAALANEISKIRTFRNSFAHMYPYSMEEQVFKEKTQHLRKVLNEALVLSGNLYEIDKKKCDEVIQDINEQIDKSRDDSMENWDITNYGNNILFMERQEVVKEKGKAQIVTLYKSFSHISPASFLIGTQLRLNVGLVFTHMEIVETASPDIGEKIDYQDILEFAQNETIKNGSKTDVLLIEGIAGTGKTTLMKLMMSQWQANVSQIQNLLDYDLLIYFECRNSAIQSFSQLLETLMPDLTSSFRNDDLMKCVLSLKLIIIADGLDELTESSKKVMQEILDISTMMVVTIVCTSRPEYVRRFYGMVPSGQHVTHLRIKGIPIDKRAEFLVKYHEELKRTCNSEQESDGLTEYLNKSSRHLQEHWRLPLNLVFLTIMWFLTPDKVNAVTSATELYTEILKLKQKRLLKKLQTNKTTCHLNPAELEKKIERIILHISWEALISLKDETIDSFPDESVQRLKAACSSLNLPHEPVLSAFLVERVISTATSTKSVFSIAHKGEQDYMAANYLIQSLCGKDLRFDITSILDIIRNHPSFCNESLRPHFIRHIVNSLPALDNVSTMEIRIVQKDTSNAVGIMDSKTDEIQLSLTTIKGVLEGLYGSNKVPSDLGRYQNTFVYAAGLLHLVPDMIRPEVADEIVTLFQESGVFDKEQWFDLITEMKCHDSIIKSIANLVPHLVSGNINIIDSRVEVYSKLLPHGKPKVVKINHEKNTSDIPEFLTLISDLADKGGNTVDINLHYNFRYAAAASQAIDDGLKRLFQKCNLRRFLGRLSDVNAGFLPMTVKRLTVTVDDNNVEAMSGLFSRLANSPSPLEVLGVHVVPGVDSGALTHLPGAGDLLLYISDVSPDSIIWACQVAKNLQPCTNSAGYNNILLPKCNLTTEGFANLTEEMRIHEVKVSGNMAIGGVIVSSSLIPRVDTQKLKEITSQAMKCNFTLNEEEAIWPKIMDSSK